MRSANENLPGRCAMTGSALLLALALAFTGSASTPNNTYTNHLGPPNGIDDTLALQDALDDCVNNHSPGCTIQLTAGTYRSGPLGAENFHGTLLGKGMGVTDIEVLTPIVPVDDVWPNLMTFIDGDIAISDMTLKVTAYEPVVPCMPWICGMYSLVLITGNTSANASFQRVAFEGGPGDGWGGYNLYAGLLFEGVDLGNLNFTGTLQMSGCRIRNSSENMRVYGVADAHVTIGGSPKSGNMFESSVLNVFVVEAARSVVEFSYNTVNTSGNFVGVLLDQAADFAHDPSQFNAHHNTINVSGDFNSGIAVVDFNHYALGTGASTFVVSNNDITLKDSPGGLPWNAIDVEFSEGSVVSNNRVSGSGSYGITTEIANGCLIKGNNVQNVNADYAAIGLLWDYWDDPPTAPTTNCTVVGGNNKANVDDEGVGNILVGVNNMHGNPPGPAIKDAMKRKQEMLKGGIAFSMAPVR